MLHLIGLFAAALFGAILFSSLLGGLSWIVARLLKHFYPSALDSTIVNVASAPLPILLLINLAYSLNIWWGEGALNGPDVQSIGFSAIFAAVLAIAGWAIGRWTAGKALQSSP